MIKKKIKFTLLLVLLLSVSYFPQNKIIISVDDAVEIGLKNSKLLHISQMKVKVNSARLNEVNASRLPSVKFTGIYSRLSEIEPFVIMMPSGPFVLSPSILNNYQLKLSVAQPLFMGFKLQSASELAEFQLKSSEAEYSKDELETIYNIKNAYWTFFKANEMKKVIDQLVLQMEAHLKDANNFYSQGLMTNNDLLKLKVQLSDLKLKQLEAQNGVQFSQINLNNILGNPLSTEIELSQNVSDNSIFESNLELNTLLESAFESRGEIKASEFRKHAGESSVTMAKSRWYPEISLYGNYYYNRPNQRIFPSQDKFNDTWDAGIMVSMELWNWFSTSYQTEQAEANLSQAIDAVGVTKEAITLEVTQNFFNFNQAKQKIEITKLAVEQAEENERITTQKFKNGLVLSSDLIDAEVSLLSAKTNYTSALVDFQLAKAKLDKSIGK